MDNQPPQPSQPQPTPEPVTPPTGQPADPSLYPPTDLDPPTQTPPPAAMQSQTHRGKAKLLAVLLAVVLAVLLGGSALAYKYWYQNPEKVVTDSLVNAMAADTMKFKLTGDMKGSTTGTLMVNGMLKNGAFSVDADVKVKTSANDIELKGSGLMDEKGDLYLKASNLDNLVDKALGANKTQLPAQVNTAISSFVTKVNAKWVKISSNDLKTFSESMAKQQSCVSDTFKKLREDDVMKTELSDLYKQHKFIAVTKELGSKDGSLGYELSSDKEQSKEFTKGLKDTQLYKKLNGCDKSFTINEDDITKDDADADDAKVQVWVSRWSHDITKVTAEVKDKDAPGTITFEPTFNEPVTVEAPKTSMSVKELTQEITNLQKAVVNAYSAAYGSTAPAISGSSSLVN